MYEMKTIETKDAVGHVLCHDITQIIKGEKKGVRFKKGHVVSQEDIPVLLSLGKDNLYVFEKKDGWLHENEAAEFLYNICASENMSPSAVKEGKIDVFAESDGLLSVDINLLNEINSLGEIIIATRFNFDPIKKGDKLAGTRIIPLLIEEEKIKVAVDIAKNNKILHLLPFIDMKVGVITTGNEIFHGRIADTFTPVVMDKLAEFGCEVVRHNILPDDTREQTKTIQSMIDANLDMVICTGGMSVDPDDKTPLAIKNTGANIVSYGAPVLPGAMFMLAYKNGIPILGLPGCVMYSKRTIFDIILPRLIAGIEVSADDIRSLGHGGLCLLCDNCTYPVCSFGKGGK